ncbi:MAG: TRAP transporter large permease subunit [Neomegalonema sp.]|nr:TRAP transporter large permease subunit [Neomegalonema sp.]
MEVFFLLLLIVLMAAALGSGYPVAFALPGAAILTIGIAAGAGYLFSGHTDAYFSHGGPSQWLSAGVTNLRGVFWEVERDTLIAIPLFIFMGLMLQRSKIAEDLLVTMAKLFGPVPGGLGISVVFVGALLAATTGIVGATVVAMGLISLPAMLRQNYSPSLATGTIAASGTLGQIIPPSIVLIILADQLASAVDQADNARKALYKTATGELTMPSEFGVISTSAGDMFLGAFVPGILLVGLYMAYILIFAILNPKKAPAVHTEGAFDAAFWGQVALTLVPPLALIFIVLGSIIAGVATVNQAGAIGAAGAAVMAGYRLHEGQGRYIPALLGLASLILVAVVTANFDTNIRNVSTTNDQIGLVLALIGVIGLVIAIGWSFLRTLRIEDTLYGVMIETAKTTALVFIILLGAAMLTSAFRAFGGEEMVREFLNGLPGGFWTQFVIVMLVIFLLGFFLDFIEIAVVVVPIVAPILLADPEANVTAVWLGVMIGLNIQTSFLTPPFGFALFYLRGVAPAAVRTLQIYRGVIAFIGLQIAALVIVGLYPPLVNYLPTRTSLTSETAPPPLNPALQYCMEEYVQEAFADEGDELRAQIAAAQALDLSILPRKLRSEIEGSFDKAAGSFDNMSEIQRIEAQVEDEAENYRPLHSTVRALEKKVARIDEQIDALRTASTRFNATQAIKDANALRIQRLESDKAALLAQIPADWAEVQGRFAKLTTAETSARNTFRRSADQAYQPVEELVSVLEDTPKLAAFTDELAQLKTDLQSLEGEAAEERIQQVERAIGEVEGSSEVKKLLSRARRALRGRRADPEKSKAEIDKAINTLAETLAWQQQAQSTLAPGLNRYLAAIGDTIGLRSQPKLPREHALYVAACQSNHRDISLNF